jgi:Ti-type conjugative transfer relaxase TraA
MDAIRQKWAAIGADRLDAAGHSVEAIRFREGYKDLAGQREAALKRGDLEWAAHCDRDATVHLGPHASAMERKGEATERGDTNRDIAATNEGRAEKIAALKAEAAQVGAEIINLAEERAKRAAEKEIFASVRTHDPARVLEAITERRATFTRADLNYALRTEIADAKERSAFMNETLARDEVVPLRDSTIGPITRYTTRAVLKAEGELLEAGRALVSGTKHGVRSDRLADVLDHHAELDHEQRDAFAHATGAEGLAIIAGEAGTGKSRTMAAVRDAYEADGKRVIGLAWTHAVVGNMKAEGFQNASTMAGELMRQAAGRSTWNSNTVLMVDEAAMLSTKHLSAFMTLARQAGAKVILVGDEKQLASIERGGMFGALREEHGAAELHTVRRVKDTEQRRAFNQMHEGGYREALGIFDQRGAITWTQTDEESRAALVAKYNFDQAADPTRTRFVFAYTNAEVAALNADIRASRKDRGELGRDHLVQSKDGELAFAAGDRIQFTGVAQKKEGKAAGLVTGNIGTVREIDGNRITVEIDRKPGMKPQVVTFTAGANAEAGEFNAFRHGYAGTIYKGQGKTLDQTYVLHSKHWRSASSYVAMTRHREDVSLFTTRGAEAWMMASGGVERLTEEQRVSAEGSYARWSAAKPELAELHAFPDYVSYVQEQQALRPADRSADLDRLAKQMGRSEEKRAASQFHQAEPRQHQGGPTPAGRRYADLDTAHRKAQEAARAGMAATDAGDPPPHSRAAWWASEAQRIAARIGRVSDPTRQAHLHRKAHQAEEGRAAPPAEKPAGGLSIDDFLSRIRREADKQAEADKTAPGRHRGRERGRTR